METGGKVEEHVQLIASLTKLKTLALGSFDYKGCATTQRTHDIMTTLQFAHGAAVTDEPRWAFGHTMVTAAAWLINDPWRAHPPPGATLRIVQTSVWSI